MARLVDPNSARARISKLLEEQPTLTNKEIAGILTLDPKIVGNTVRMIMFRRRRKETADRARAIRTQQLANIREAGTHVLRSEAAKLREARKAEPQVSIEDIERIKAAALDPAERILLFADIAARAKDETQLRALLAIHELQTQSGAISTLPLITNEAEMDTRLARMMAAAGRESVDRALKIAFPEAVNGTPQAEAPDTGDGVEDGGGGVVGRSAEG